MFRIKPKLGTLSTFIDDLTKALSLAGIKTSRPGSMNATYDYENYEYNYLYVYDTPPAEPCSERVEYPTKSEYEIPLTNLNFNFRQALFEPAQDTSLACEACR